MTQPATQQGPIDPQHIAQVAMTIGKLVQDVDPRVVAAAMIPVVIGAANKAGLTRDQLLGAITHGYDRTAAMMTALGLDPNGPVPADIEERVMRFLREQQGQAKPPSP
jgi:hypothetical protein